ncbi:MAG: HAD family phosphatase [Coriobacteriales bacterium]|nr:HAD family phosphatase [Coriobacteriales bacterium]
MAPLPPYLADDASALEALRDIEILYTDLDGTLLSKGGVLLADSAGTPSTVTAEAIVTLNRAGLTVVPVSGRNRVQLIEVVRFVGWRDFIGEVGAVIVRGIGTPERVIEYNTGEWPDNLLPSGQTPLDLIESWDAYEALTSAFPRKIEHHAPWHEGREATHLLRGCIEEADGQRVLDELGVPIDLVDNGLIHPRHELDCADHVHAFHVVPRGVNKAQAISRDLAERGLKPSQAMAIGDSAADLAMGDAVGLIAMVENAIESPMTRRALEREPRARLMRGARGEGWAELARLWLDARALA